jgi:uncharacterized protein YyaL (SSP411 family)
MQKVVPPVLLFSLALLFSSATPVEKSSGLWQSWDEVKRLAAERQQPIFIDMYTDWCHYCKVMDATTYKNDSVISYLKNNYQRFKFNAEGKDTIRWNKLAYTFNNRFEVHDFAVYLTRGSIVYPTTIIIAPGGQPYYRHGQIDVPEMEVLLKYFTRNKADTSTLVAFSKTFTPTWK